MFKDCNSECLVDFVGEAGGTIKCSVCNRKYHAICVGLCTAETPYVCCADNNSNKM